jgi:hypothetical protein
MCVTALDEKELSNFLGDMPDLRRPFFARRKRTRGAIRGVFSTGIYVSFHRVNKSVRIFSREDDDPTTLREIV